MNIAEGIEYAGVNDHDIDLFEGQYDVREGGMAYNSYVILDEQPAVMDSVDAHFVDEWLGNVERALGGKQPAYLVVQHVEPDHSAGVGAFLEKYPEAKIVATGTAYKILKNFFATEFEERRVVVKEGETLCLGAHTLQFIMAPKVHWPEVMFTYDSTAKVLFSADAFGKFGALDYDDPEGWACEARRYYFGIVGKFGVNVQKVLQKLDGMDIQVICPLHGPVLDSNLGYYLDTYNTWSSYGVESEGVCIAYSSVYGNTKQAAEELAAALGAKGAHAAISDLARDDMAEVVEDAFRYGKLVLASITYCGDVFPHMSTFIHALAERNYQNRTIAFIQAGSWFPESGKKMQALCEEMEGITFAETMVTVKGMVNDITREQIEALADELSA